MFFHNSNGSAKRGKITNINRLITGTIPVLVLLSACVSPVSTVTTTPGTSTPTIPSVTIAPTASPTVTLTPTPIPKHFGECPDIKEDLIPDFKNAFGTHPENFVTPVQNFLNQGGSPKVIVATFQEADLPIFQGDLTGDGVPELGISDRSLSILGCVNQKYEVLASILAEFGSNNIISTQDMNLNKLPDIIIHNPSSCGPMWNCSEAYIYEWDGQQFQNTVQTDNYDVITMLGAFMVSIKDSDGNGTQELVTTGGVPSWFADYADGLPWREQSDTYMWNGKAFVLDKTEFSSPEYRFQAVQDGDRATLQGEYKKALNYYQQAISSNALEWWTPERKDYEEAKVNSSFDTITTPFPKPVRDPAEKPNLAAYAQYRIMLLYILQDMDTEAATAYNTLVKRFPEGQAGYNYVDMANVFWTEYQSSSNITHACSKAVSYASIHRAEILHYLGDTDQSYYHGWQSLKYTPIDICPFDS